MNKPPAKFSDLFDRLAEHANRDYLTVEDAARFFKSITAALEQTRTMMAEQIAAKLATLQDGKTPTAEELMALIRPLIPEVKDGATPTKAELIALIKPLIPDPVPPPTKDEIAGDIEARIEERLPQFATVFRDGLETLQGDERLEASAIKGLDERFAEVTTLASQRIQTPAKAYMVHTKDATAQCDGVTKQFSVGGTHRGIVGVFGTEFPQIYRPVIDYTETNTGILLTSAVSAPQTGQTLIIQFLK